jgi:invasion protein IalB
MSPEERVMVRFLKPLAFTNLAVVVFCYFSSASAESSSPEQKATIGSWTLFCTDGATKPSASDCALAAASVSDIDKTLWIRVGLAFDVEAANAKMTIRIPRTDYFKRWIFVSTDAEKVGRAFVDECDKDFCRSSVRLESKNLDAIFNAKVLNIQYQVKREQGISLAIDMSGFLPAFGELQKVVGMKQKNPDDGVVAGAGVFGPNVTTFLVTLKTPPSGNIRGRDALFGERATNCMASSNSLVVRAGREVQNAYDVAKWAAAADKCTGQHVVWIDPNFDGGYEEVNLFDKANIARIIRVINDRVPNHRLEFVYTNSEGIPFQLTDPK